MPNWEDCSQNLIYSKSPHNPVCIGLAPSVHTVIFLMVQIVLFYLGIILHTAVTFNQNHLNSF
jgi:hypothetical protein